MKIWLAGFALLVACDDPEARAPAPDAPPVVAPDQRVPCIRSVAPASGRVGTQVTLFGEFGDLPRPITFGSGSEVGATVVSWSATQVVVTVPVTGWGTYGLSLPEGCKLPAPPSFQVTAPPRVYINNNVNNADGFNTITTMSYDPVTGALAALGPPTSTGLPASGRPGCSDSLTLHNGQLYASSDTGVAVFNIDLETGALIPLAGGSSFPTGARGGGDVAWTIGAFVWTATGSGVTAWHLGAGNSLVRPLAVSTTPARAMALFGDRPSRAFTTRDDGTFDAWSVSYQPASPDGVNPAWTPVAGSPFGTAANAPAPWIVYRTPASDRKLFVPAPGGLRLWADTLDTLTELPGSPFVLDPAMSALGRPVFLRALGTTSLYMTTLGGNAIVGATLGADQVPTAIAGSPWSFALAVTNLSCLATAHAANPDAIRLIATDAGNRRAAVFDLPAVGLAPVPVAGSPFEMTNTPSELASGIAVLQD